MQGIYKVNTKVMPLPLLRTIKYRFRIFPMTIRRGKVVTLLAPLGQKATSNRKIIVNPASIRISKKVAVIKPSYFNAGFQLHK